MNMNEALQQSLYDKLSREQDKYRDWLKGQPPEEILHHSYEYTVREVLRSGNRLHGHDPRQHRGNGKG